MRRDEWVATLKAGDEVAVRSGMSNEPSLYRVERVTKTGRVLIPMGGVTAQEFNPDGYMRGGGTWMRTQLVPITDEVREEVFRSNACARLRAVRFGELDTATLRRLLTALKAVP